MGLECPSCERQSVEKRGPNLPVNIKRREIDDITDKFVCRNQDCKWTGDENALPVEYAEEVPENHKSVLNWKAGFDSPSETQKTASTTAADGGLEFVDTRDTDSDDSSTSRSSKQSIDPTESDNDHTTLDDFF